MERDVTKKLIEFVQSTPYEKIPEEIVNMQNPDPERLSQGCWPGPSNLLAENWPKS